MYVSVHTCSPPPPPPPLLPSFFLLLLSLLVTSLGHIKLTDFGLSKIGFVNYAAHVIEDAWTKDNQFIDKEVYGTPDYIAPEVILGLPYGMERGGSE